MHPKISYTIEEATKRMESYCTYQDRCHMEVRQKLRAMGMIPQAIDHIIVKLVENDFLNEQRFANNFVRGKFNQKNWGRIRIIAELKSRDISQNIIKISTKMLEGPQYQEKLQDLARKRMNQLSAESNEARKKRKVADYLLYRGWESALVYDVIRELFKG